jgi:hypothetical protein
MRDCSQLCTYVFTVRDRRIKRTLCGVLGLLSLFRPSWLAIASPPSIERHSSTEKLTELTRNLIPNSDGELPSLCIVLLHNSRAKSHNTCRVTDQARILRQVCKRSLLFLLQSKSDVISLSISSVVHGQLLACVD